ncbi:MAG: serine hydrolase domain-containing protein [Omnitrophica WOR_2 bacterium]
MDIVQPEKLGFSSKRLGRIRSVMQRFIDEGKYAGTLTLISRQGEVVHCEKVGLRDIEAGKPIQEDTIFRIYSMTKPITSAALMMLFEEGRFLLSDPLTNYLPEFQGIQVAESEPDGQVKLVAPRRPITLHDLFTHTAGLSYGFEFEDDNYADQLFRERVDPLWRSRGPQALHDLVQAIASVPLRQHPGQGFKYSAALDVLGYLVEVFSGMPFGDFLRQRIFEPLGMKDTSFFVPAEKVGRFACMYGPTEENEASLVGRLKNIDPLEKSYFLHPDRLQGGGGGLVSTAPDYLRFCQMMLNHGELDGQRLLGRKTVELMRMNHLPDGMYVDQDTQAYGFGLGGYVLLDPAKATVSSTLLPRSGSTGNWGWSGSANTYFWIDFQEQIIAMILIQYQPFQPHPIEDIFGNLVYQALI